MVAGAKTAHQWYAAGCRTLEDIREGKGGIKLTSAQQIGLKYYDGTTCVSNTVVNSLILIEDINSRMPREEAEAIYNLIKPVGMCACLSR